MRAIPPISADDAATLNDRFRAADPEELLAWAAERFGTRATMACSLGLEDMVLVHMLRADPKAAQTDISVFVLDTGRLNQETYDVMGEAQARYDMQFQVYFPDTTAVESLLRTKGPNSFYESVDNRKECCRIRKVEPMGRALANVDAWITGLRREQSVTRAELARVEIDQAHGGILKLNPLADWTIEQVNNYIKANRVPRNVLHERGFPSIGCAPCTRAIEPGEDLRAGRWWWENPDMKECGIHVAQPPGNTKG